MDFADGFFDRYVTDPCPRAPAEPPRRDPRGVAAARQAGRANVGGDSHRRQPRLWSGPQISAQRVWRRHFDAPYAEFYKREHINLVPEILAELHPYFTIKTKRFFPLGVPLWFCNLSIGLVLIPRPEPLLDVRTSR